MTSLIEKFKNVHFPNWMRQIKTDYPMPEVKAANDNINNSVAAADDDKVVLFDELQRAYIETLLYGKGAINFQRPQKHVIFMAQDMLPSDVIDSFKFKLKMPVSVKRRLRRDKKNYQKVREWLNEVEKSVNQALFMSNANKR